MRMLLPALTLALIATAWLLARDPVVPAKDLSTVSRERPDTPGRPPPILRGGYYARRIAELLEGAARQREQRRDDQRFAKRRVATLQAEIEALEAGLAGDGATSRERSARLEEAQKALRGARFEVAYLWCLEVPYSGRIWSVQPVHSGRVVRADNDDNVYEVSLGEADGVEPGFQYIVSRGEDYIATLDILEVRARSAIAFAVLSLSKGRIQRGDKIMNGE